MEAEVFLDTHVVVWLYAGELVLLSRKAKKVIEDSELLISPISLLEIDYLFETKKITVRGRPILDDLQEKLDLKVAEDPFIEVVSKASHVTWTRDPFDRLIVAHALLRSIPLITKDRSIKRHYHRCVW